MDKLTEANSARVDEIGKILRSAEPIIGMTGYAHTITIAHQNATALLAEAATQFRELLDYSGGADHALADEYVVDRIDALLIKIGSAG